MKIFIIGAGFTGMQLARALVLERNNVILIATTFAGALAGLDVFTAFTGALSMAGNIGPAFGQLGPASNYGALAAPLKWFYMFAMLAGRLEIYTLLILVGRICFLRRQT